MTSQTKKRSDNWSIEDKLLLQELVRERVQILENKNTDTNTNSRKVAAWADLHRSFNVMRNGSERTVAQLKSRWGSMKTNEKKKFTAERVERLKTGGGPPPREEPTDSGDIRAWLPQEFETDTNRYDSDSVNQALPHAVEAAATAAATQQPEAPPPATEEPPIRIVASPSPPPVQQATTPEAPAPAPQRNLRMRRRKTTQPTGVSGQAVANIAAVEIRCREELHEAQMNNENKKKRILQLKEELILMKIEYYKNK